LNWKPQTALDKYKLRRQGHLDPAAADARLKWKYLQLAGLTVLLAVAIKFAIPGRISPIEITYEVDLAAAPQGAMVITLMASGDLPRQLDLEFPPGVFGDAGNGVNTGLPSAHGLNEDGSQGMALGLERGAEGWRLHTRGQSRVGLIYRVDLTRTQQAETDIRRHISTPIRGGLRAAGFEVFLQPVGVPVDRITVTLHNPSGLPVLVPWPALAHGGEIPPTQPKDPAADPAQDVAPAHLGFGQRYQPVDEQTAAGQMVAVDKAAPTAVVPANLFFHPRDLAELNNAILLCGEIRTATAQAHDSVIQYATDREWLFDDSDALNLVRRIARTEMGFWGSSPTEQITVLMAANEVNSSEGFDLYGVHTGSSVLLMLHPETTLGLLKEQAASVIAHEMFHGWLGEAIPQTDPETLWFTEGATTWYAARMLASAGVWTPEHARNTLTSRLERDYATSDLLGKLSVADAAAEVMANRAQVSFAYAGGVAACLALDQWLAENTGRRRPMDEILRHLYTQGDGTPLSRASIERAVIAVTGLDCSAWLDEYVYGPTPLPPVDRVL